MPTLVTGAKSIKAVMPRAVITAVPLGVPARTKSRILLKKIPPVLPMLLAPNVLYLPTSAIGVNTTMPAMRLQVNMAVRRVLIVIRMIGVVGRNPSH